MRLLHILFLATLVFCLFVVFLGSTGLFTLVGTHEFIRRSTHMLRTGQISKHDDYRSSTSTNFTKSWFAIARGKQYLPRSKSKTATQMTKYPLILFWTTFWRANFRYTYLEDLEFSKLVCANSLCEVTSNQSRFTESAAVVVHVFDGMNPLPETRQPWQRVVLFSHEPPTYVMKVGPRYNGMFNWTMTYRRDSDFVAPYGRMIENGVGSESVTTTNHAQGRTKLVLWIGSNCKARSKRLNYIKALQRHVPVSMYGKCGRGHLTELNTIKESRRHKFYLSFESAICKDYATEKLFNGALRLGMVPIVLGGADYRTILPKHSYIDIADYRSPAELAKYLKHLDKNDDLYNEYFEWKRSWHISNIKWPAEAFCNLCNRLTFAVDEPHSVYTDIYGWLHGGTCISPEEKYPHLKVSFENKKGNSTTVDT